MEKITVVVTVLNEEGTIVPLMEALAQQTLPASAVIIADGGSRDKTLSLVQKFVRSHPQFHLMEKKGNRSVSRNAAIHKATSNLIAITDAGCVPHPNWLEELAHAAQKMTIPNFVVAGYYDAQAKTPFEAAVVPYVLVMPDRVNPDDFLPATRSMLISKSAWQKVGGFHEALSDNEDYAFAHALKKNGVQFGFTAKAKVRWLPRTNLGQFSTMIFRFARGDAQARIWRPKVVFIFVRYLFVLLFSLVWWQAGLPMAVLVYIYALGFFLYTVWAVKKNYRYAKKGWYWLPILQFTADSSVIAGTISGWMIPVTPISEISASQKDLHEKGSK